MTACTKELEATRDDYVQQSGKILAIPCNTLQSTASTDVLHEDLELWDGIHEIQAIALGRPRNYDELGRPHYAAAAAVQTRLSLLSVRRLTCHEAEL